MKTAEATTIEKMTIEEFLKLNYATESYSKYWRWLKSDNENEWLKDEQAVKAAKIDLSIFSERLQEFENYETPIEGQWIKGYDGKMTRFTHCWNDGVQTGGGQGSYYLCSNGKASYSGGLDSSVPYDLLERTEERVKGTFWIFHKECSGAHRGVYYTHPCPVWKLKTIDKINDIKRIPSQYPVVEVSEDVYDDALGAVPPIAWQGGFFAMGEAYSHSGVLPVYYCFVKINGKFYCNVNTIEEAHKQFREFITKLI